MLDAALYDEWARAIADGRPYGNNEPFYHSPGYAYFLGAIYEALGPRPLAAVLVQTMMGLGTILLTTLLGRRLFGPKAGILAGVFVVLSAPFYFFEAKLLDATLSVFTGTLAVYLAIRAQKKPLIFAAGLAAGALGVVRANLLLVPMLILVIWMFEASKHRRSWMNVVVYAMGAVLALLPPFVHNLERGAFVPVATQGGFNFYVGNSRAATGVFTDLTGTTGIIARQEAEADSLMRVDLGRVLPPGQESRYWMRRALREIAGDPGHWLGLLGKKSLLYVNRQEENVNGSLELEKEHVWILRAAAVPFNLLVWLGVLGIVLAWGEARRGTRSFTALAIPGTIIIATFVTCILFFVITRLRLPAVPVLAVFSAFAVTRGFDLWHTLKRKLVLAGALGILFLTALTWTSPLGVPRNPGWEASLVLEGAKALEKKGDTGKAAAMYRLAGEVNPVSVEALLGEAEAAMRAGDMTRTIALYERARDIAPDRFAVRNNLGILYFNTGNLEPSMREMEEASRLEPSAASPYRYLIEALNVSGKKDEALVWQERARENGVDLTAP